MTSWRPEWMWVDGAFRAGYALDVDAAGRIAYVGPEADSTAEDVRRLPGKAMLPGLIDIHSHSFQRALRGKAESRRRSGPNFWSWRDTMYRCALALTPEEIYDVARMAFLEMVLAGITTVGEFHYLHRTAAGERYDNPNLLAEQVIRAAQSVGIRMVLLNCAYVRAGFQLPPDPGQVRFLHPDPERFLADSEMLRKQTAHLPTVSFGLAPHSLRAVPREYLVRVADWSRPAAFPLHMHVSEQPAEVDACRAEYNCTPFELLDGLGMLHENFTAIHAIHLQPGEIERMGRGAITVGACPTTERNLGDGILPADELMKAGVSIAFGTDSHSQTDGFENARELETNLRLSKLERAVLDGSLDQPMSVLLLDCATRSGARSLHVEAGALEAGKFADFLTIDLQDAAVAGAQPEDLLNTIVLSASPRAIADVVVHGEPVVTAHRHVRGAEIMEAFARVQRRLGAEH